jgi:hypothetical protein
VGRLQDGLTEAASGAELLREGSNRAHVGAAQLAKDLERAAGGGDLGLHDLLPEFRKGSLGRPRKFARG